MSSISVRINSKLKKLMESHKHINWSEIIRQAIAKKLQNEQKKNIARAVLINEKIRKKAPDNYDSTEIIRKFRDERH
ncbi:hypothetical protein DSAG12_01985 [Promethearchaeum syntrophicum]|uniref:Ribbon-helix-helix protein CopG domain-containing protein n=1 Tax=Promethearchaeum syntrophicum TaxID=2594042 RepID=A0A5B9DBV2_9ARCH|nr:hypothetical protein [Candidatus Prometheoarchaeum syntrophicum]QEE16156.1 hypothetical protein DSAG12_01985 [Candidatus Prometheoarchaeum syntrophicum]